MLSRAFTPNTVAKLRSAVGIAGVTLVLLITVGIAALFLALTSASRNCSASGLKPTDCAALIEHPATLARPTAAGIQTRLSPP